MPSLLGIDNGLTVTKAVIFDVDGRQLAVARRRVPQSIPQPHWVERDMAGLWSATAEAIREAIHLSGRPAHDIKAVAATAHGDGLYLLDHEKQPLGPGILSLDSRAGGILAGWQQSQLPERALTLTGQMPHVSAPSTLLAWLKAQDPQRFARIGHVLACKDWLRFCLTGEIATDRTEASTSFTDVKTQVYTSDALSLYGLEALAQALPPILHSTDVAGRVTAKAAALTGLAVGTPVAAGLHDVTASVLGIGAHRQEVVGIVAGTYSINEVISPSPKVDSRWLCRNAIEPGLWNNMAISPASAANYDWFLDTFCRSDQARIAADGGSIHTLLAAEIDDALKRPSTVLFHPYLFGSPFGDGASGSFVGLHGWHERGDLLKAVLEGIAFNHRHHVAALRDGFPMREAILTGGASRNPTFAQMFADVLGLPVTVTATEEAAAFGAALCAGAAIGIYHSAQDDPRDLGASAHVYQPDPRRAADFDQRYDLFTQISETMAPLWPALERLGAKS